MSLRERVLHKSLKSPAFGGKSSVKDLLARLTLRVIHPLEKQRTITARRPINVKDLPKKPELTWYDLPESITKRIPPQGF